MPDFRLALTSSEATRRAYPVYHRVIDVPLADREHEVKGPARVPGRVASLRSSGSGGNSRSLAVLVLAAVPIAARPSRGSE